MMPATLHPEQVSADCQSRGRWAFGLTARCIGLLAVGFLLLAPGFYEARLSYAMLVWDGIVIAAAMLDLRRLPPPAKIIATRSWRGVPMLDSETEVELTIENNSSVLLDCRLTDDLPRAFARDTETHRLSVYRSSSASVRYRATAQERGDWQAGWLYVRYRSPLGLSERWARAPLTQTVRVYPALRTTDEQQIFLARSRQIEAQLRRARQRGLGREFESLREYREGDDLRDVCWTATARRGNLITRQYQIERSQAVWIVLDCGRLMRSRVGLTRAGDIGPRRQEHAKLDHACSTAVAMAQLALYSGDRVGLLAYGQSIQQKLLPSRGAAHLRQIIESLAQVRAEISEADHLLATAALNRLQPRRALILWITDMAETAMRPEVIDGAMQLLRRHVLLFVAMAQPEVEAIAAMRPRNVEEMFRTAAAQEMADRRETLLAQLREQGALTLDLNPDVLASSVLNEYLRVKERAML